MQAFSPFVREDLRDLDNLFQGVTAVVPMREIAAGNRRHDVIGVRHDVDDNKDSFWTALNMARWEHARGYRTTYFLLHSASYWGTQMWRDGVAEILELGHEVGIHVNALAEAIRGKGDPQDILGDAIADLRQLGADVTGSAGHGDELCHRFNFVNDEIFVECPRPGYGETDRWIGPTRAHPKYTPVKLERVPRAELGLEYDSVWLPRRFYASDSGGRWNKIWDEVEREAWGDEGQLHMLIHPDWWGDAF